VCQSLRGAEHATLRGCETFESCVHGPIVYVVGLTTLLGPGVLWMQLAAW
jgi:hypothetical protein